MLWALKRWLYSGAEPPQKAETEMAWTSQREDWVSYGIELQAVEEVELEEAVSIVAVCMGGGPAEVWQVAGREQE